MSDIVNESTTSSFNQRFHCSHAGNFENEILLARLPECDAEALRLALQGLIDRHPLLRTSFHAYQESSEQAALKVIEHSPSSVSTRADFHIVDCSEMHNSNVQSLVATEAFREFSLTQPSLLRARLFLHAGQCFAQIDDLQQKKSRADGSKSAASSVTGQHVLLISVAPIVADKWSLTLLIDDLKGGFKIL
jgi:hypothetical protein